MTWGKKGVLKDECLLGELKYCSSLDIERRREGAGRLRGVTEEKGEGGVERVLAWERTTRKLQDFLKENEREKVVSLPIQRVEKKKIGKEGCFVHSRRGER